MSFSPKLPTARFGARRPSISIRSLHSQQHSMALPTLHSELNCLQSLHQVLQQRLDLERVHTSSLITWHTNALETGPYPTHALRVVFLSLFDATKNDIHARRVMEDTLQSQIDRVLAAMEELRGHFERITARSKKLEEFDELAMGALEKRKLRYERWQAWRSRPASPTGARLRSKPRNSPALSEHKMIAAYDLADMQFRRYISKAEVARCSFKDKAIVEIAPISLAYRIAIDAITKCLWLFAKNQQECAGNTSVGASTIVNLADGISGFRVANVFQEALTSEARNISTALMPYDNLETNSRFPTIQSQPIILGFSLPSYYLSFTASTKFVVNVFCQLVSFVHDHQAWDRYAIRSTSTDHALARTIRNLERSWTRDGDLNRDLLRDLGPSTCADLVKTLLASFSEPLFDCSEVAAETLRLWNPDTGHHADTTLAGQSNQDDAMSLVLPVSLLDSRPQGEMVRALCASLIPLFKESPQMTQDLVSEVFSDLLTRKGECIKHAVPSLIKEFSTIVTVIGTINALRRPLQSDRARSGGIALEGEKGVLNYGGEDNTPTINDVESLRKGIIKTSKNKVQAPYTILLVGETGVGKSSLLEFITNVLIGNNIDCYDFTIPDNGNKQNGSSDQNQTGSACCYEITSNNGIVIRILDISGLTDTRGVRQDEIHKKSIVTEIQKHMDFISAVLILANGTVRRISVGLDSALSTLAAILPKTLGNHIAFMFTNVTSWLSCNFPWDTVPEVFKDAPQFLLDNPVAVQKKYLQFADLYPEEGTRAMRNDVEAGEQRALEMLVEFFDWLDGREQLPTTDIVYFHGIPQKIEALIPKILAQMDQAVAMKAEIEKLMIALKKSSADMGALSNFERSVNTPFWGLQATTNHKTDKQASFDENMKKKWEVTKNKKEKTEIFIALKAMVLHDLNKTINCAPGYLVQLVEQYAPLPLSGNFMEKLGRTVRLLEQMYKDMEKKGISQDLLQQGKESLDHIQRNLVSE